ncbi:ThiF family adenylyltransferase [uncultured Tyzzerella sp.]|uniref:ThiF family adenylyltransferase n=1 Tax=uncultured Tyzzerella sp. TaxID=2321398 RepID=UPI00294237D6|nr:ThiF family adenylyltransferase [uncultured Tyzzerella sp.]
MNTRKRKSFKVNNELIKLLEMIDGKTTTYQICKLMKDNYNVDDDEVKSILTHLENQKIITKVNFNTNIIGCDDIKRYDRQINYFSEFLQSEELALQAQKKLMDSKIVIFGCGAIGGVIACQLVMAGARNIILYDYDIVDQSDVSRHIYFNNKNFKKSKSEVLKQTLQDIDNRVNITTVDEKMNTKTNIENIISNNDFIVNTLDEPYIGYTSCKISRMCIKYKKAHYIVGGFDAHLASTGEIIIPGITPCVDCYATYFGEKLKGWKPKKHPVEDRSMQIGGISSMSLFSASFATIEIIKYICGLIDMQDKNNYKTRGEMLFDSMELTYLNVKRDANCLICG